MSVALSFGIRNSVNSLSDINTAIEVANKRLATGKKVNSALDNPNAFFQAEGFRKEARDLQGLQDSFDAALKTVDKAGKAIAGAQKLIESALGLARDARRLGNTDAGGRDALGTQIQDLIKQAANLFVDASYNGKNLLVADNAAPLASDNLVVQTNLSVGATQTNVTITAQDFRLSAAPAVGNIYGSATATLALSTANTGIQATASAGADQSETIAYAAGNFTAAAGDTKLDNLIASLTQISSTVSNRGKVLSAAATSIQVRNEFTRDVTRILNSAADNLTLADINEEGAALTSLQTRQQLAVSALSLAGRSDQAILRLF
jgi:flagellin